MEKTGLYRRITHDSATATSHGAMALGASSLAHQSIIPIGLQAYRFNGNSTGVTALNRTCVEECCLLGYKNPVRTSQETH
jgi:hypothetical protein